MVEQTLSYNLALLSEINSMLIYCEHSTKRLHYIFNLMLRELLGIDFSIITIKEEFIKHIGPKFSYSEAMIADEINFKPVKLLFQENIIQQNIEVSDWQNLKVFFRTDGSVPFDLFAAAFYVVSRYEEYLPHSKDRYGRYNSNESFLVKESLAMRPLVNEYAALLKRILSEKYPRLIFNEAAYLFISTIDIDNAFAYKHKGPGRTAGALMRAALRFNFNEITKRIKVISGSAIDPFDTYSYLQQVHFEKKIKPKLFYLLGDLSKYDRNVSASNTAVQQQYRNNDYWADSCLHPSFRSNENPKLIRIEKDRLEKITGRTVIRSRQHFLKFHLPGTYRNLIAAGIKEDYSMGFADVAGFRAGICSPFLFFDLKKNETTALRIFPVTIMDSTLNTYLKLSPDLAKEKITELIKIVKQHNGTFISLWHNETVSETGIWRGWKNVFEFCLNEACKKELP